MFHQGHNIDGTKSALTIFASSVARAWLGGTDVGEIWKHMRVSFKGRSVREHVPGTLEKIRFRELLKTTLHCTRHQ